MYVTEMLKPAVFTALVAENLLKDSSIHLFCKSTDHAFPKPKCALVMKGHLGNYPLYSVRRVSLTSYDSCKDNMDEYNICFLSLQLSQLDSNAYIVVLSCSILAIA